MHMPRMYMHIIIMTAANFIQRNFLPSKIIVVIINTAFKNVNTFFQIFLILTETKRYGIKCV